MIGISIREFAKRDGCNDKLVRRAIQEGRITALPDGKLDPALVGTAWRETNRRAIAMQEGESPETAAKREIELHGAPYSLMEAERIKENYLAMLRQLEYEVKKKELIPFSEATDRIVKACSNIRNRFLSLPSECSPQIKRLKTEGEVEKFLRERVTEILQGLVIDLKSQ